MLEGWSNIKTHKNTYNKYSQCKRQRNCFEKMLIPILIPLENGLLSYENPNYHLDPKSIKHNHNLFEEIMSESAGMMKQRAEPHTAKVIMTNRKGYACLDIGSMGVDVKENFE